MTKPTDPTTVAIVELTAERDRLRIENRVLCKTVVAAYADLDAAIAVRDRLARIGDGVAAGAIQQAIREVREHFTKTARQDVADEISAIWGKGLPS